MRKRGSFCALAALLSVGSAALANYQMSPIIGLDWTGGGATVQNAGGTYGVFTGIATAAGGLTLLESTTTPVRDDIVAFDGVSEPINDYLAVVGSVLRNVNETDVDNGNGTRTLTVTVLGRDAAGGPADLWPSGLVNGSGTALTSGGFGLGLTLPASLGGADPFNLTPGDSITSATVAISTAGTFAAPLNLPAAPFFAASGNYPVSTWNGVIGIAFGNGATGATVEDGIRLTINYTPVPEPTTLSLAAAATALIRRRRA